MAITPINMSRTSFNMRTVSLLDSLRQNTLQIFLEQNRLASGLKLNAPSEDPVLAGKATQLSEALERQGQILANIQHGDSFLATTDAAVTEINDLLIDAHNIALEMVNSHANQDQRDSMAELVTGIIDQLVIVGNRQYQGVFLFGGQETRRVPFTQQHGGVEYRGDRGSLIADVDFLQDPEINLTGDQLFGALAGKITGSVDLSPAADADTRLADLRGAAGLGADGGLIRISLDQPETAFTVDLRTADTVGDVIDLMNQAAEDAGLTVGSDFEATLESGGRMLEITGVGSITIEDLGSGTTARDLGIRGTALQIFTGQDFGPRLTAMTTVDSLFGGLGATLGSLQIQNGSLTETIDLSGATTIQDILNRINAAGVEVHAEINEDGTGIDVVNLMSGMALTIGEDGGTTATLLGIRSFQSDTLLSDLNNGKGVDIREGHDDLMIIARDGSSFNVRLDGATTVQDVLDMINAAAGAAGVSITASLTTIGNGIRLDDLTGGTGDLRVDRAGGSAAIDGLGLEQSVSGNILIGDDTSATEPDNMFTALINLHAALVTGGELVEQNITNAAERIEEFIELSSRMQGVVGARSRAMSTRLQLTESAVLTTESLLSEVRDLDYTEAVTRFQQAQTTLQANLMTGSRLLQLSLLDYI